MVASGLPGCQQVCPGCQVKNRIALKTTLAAPRGALSLADGSNVGMSSKVTGWVWDQSLPIQRKCVLLWLAERATDNGVCFPGQAEIRQKTGLSESMVRRYLHWLASDHDEDGQAKQPLVRIIERPIDGERNTSNVYVLLVPWAGTLMSSAS